MRRLMCGVVVCLMASTAFAQLSSQGTLAGLINGVLAPIGSPNSPGVMAPVISGASTSVIDANGNLLVFDVFYNFTNTTARGSFAAKTHVTVITARANDASKTSFDYDGAFQILGVGRHAVYAMVDLYGTPIVPVNVPTAIAGGGGSSGSIVVLPLPPILPIPVLPNRKLVALNALIGTFPSPLPSIDLLSGDDVKISSLDNATTDTIAVVSLIPSPVIAITPGVNTGTATATGSALVRSVSHSVRMFTFDGGSFTAINKTPITVP